MPISGEFHYESLKHGTDVETMGWECQGEHGKEEVQGSVSEKTVGERCPCKDGILSRELVLVSYAAVRNNRKCSGIKQLIIILETYLEIRSLK